MTLKERISRAWAHRKLRRGQCDQCRAVLPDDAGQRLCATCAENPENRMYIL